jgi:hypothetical protein
MDSGARVCPFCGEAPGAGMFCAACGRNLAAVDQLPTRGEWAAGPAAQPLAVRCADATAAFLAAMHAAGDPGAAPMPIASRSTLRRVPKVHGWVVRPVARDDTSSPRRYEPGILLGVDGRFHRVDSELRGWGQRDFPQYHHTVGIDPIDMPVDERLIEDLAAVLREHNVGRAPEPSSD